MVHCVCGAQRWEHGGAWCKTIGSLTRRYPPMRSKALSALFVTLCVAGCVRSDLAPGVSPERIKGVQPGMTTDAVIGMLGLPLSVNAALHVHQGYCLGLSRPTDRSVSHAAEIHLFLDSIFNAPPCCSARRREQEEGQFTLNYARMVEEDGISPMLWVHFDKTGHVVEVYARLNSRVALRDDVGIYHMNAKSPTYCNDDLLHKYFLQ